MIAKKFIRSLCLLMVVGVGPAASNVSSQEWSWTTSQIDVEGTDSAVVADYDGNIHVSYRYPTHGELKYGFLPAGGSHWFTMTLDEMLGFFLTDIALDPKGNPYICYSPGIIKLAAFDGRRWKTQQIDPGSALISYYCSIKFGPSGAPQLSWYVEGAFTLRYAVFQDSAWIARSVDTQDLPGKFNSLAVDSSGKPQLSYIALNGFQLKYARMAGNDWVRMTLEGPTQGLQKSQSDAGMGNSIAVDRDGNPMISYFDTSSLKFARLINGRWKFEVVDQFPAVPQWGWRMFRTKTLLDRNGYPHIGYQCPSGLKHAWWDGREWKTQVILGPTGTTYDGGVAMDGAGNLYFSYTDPVQKNLMLAIGHHSADPEAAESHLNHEPKKQP